jgi:hypothetical protein
MTTDTDIARRTGKPKKLLSYIKKYKRKKNNPMEELKLPLYPELWNKVLAEFQKRISKKNSDEDFFTIEPHAKFSPKIKRLLNSLALQMGVRVTNVDPKIMTSLMAQYGNPQYLQVFGKKSLPISLTSLDTALLTSFQQSAKSNEKRVKQQKKKSKD